MFCTYPAYHELESINIIITFIIIIMTIVADAAVAVQSRLVHALLVHAAVAPMYACLDSH